MVAEVRPRPFGVSGDPRVTGWVADNALLKGFLGFDPLSVGPKQRQMALEVELPAFLEEMYYVLAKVGAVLVNSWGGQKVTDGEAYNAHLNNLPADQRPKPPPPGTAPYELQDFYSPRVRAHLTLRRRRELQAYLPWEADPEHLNDLLLAYRLGCLNEGARAWLEPLLPAIEAYLKA